ncbi:MAG TPA: ribonuclease P protein component [Polyangium sp.]|nr:ribonuclease P protein component [Polyangium sp.]
MLPTDGTSPPLKSSRGTSESRETLPRSRRLLRREDFLRIQEEGVRVSTRHLLLLLEPRSDGGPTRLGIVASRKVGGAVQRNRAKRLLRETFRRNSKHFPANVNLVVIVRPGVDVLSQSDVEAEIASVASLLRKRASGKTTPGRTDRKPAKPRP